MLLRIGIAAALGWTGAHAGNIAFDKKKLGDLSNGSCEFADYNGDGSMDVACGDSWFSGPDWTRHIFRDGRQDDMLLARDVDGDNKVDLVASMHGDAVWYKNPGTPTGNWPVAPVGCRVGHSGAWWDVDGDGKKNELISDVADEPTMWSEWVGGKWVCNTIANNKDNWGAGMGDVNGDGRADYIRPNVWYEAPVNRRAGTWIPHPIAIGALEDRPTLAVQELPFVERIHELRNAIGQHGHTVQIYAMDVNGDGLNDLLASSGHRLGVFWYEQVKKGNEITFRSHIIDGELSILHCLHLADMDRDGDLDLVTGKRHRGHGKDEDPFTETPLFVVWYEFTKGKAPYWQRHFITHGEGITAGTQVGIGDYDKDGDSDVAVINVMADGQGGGPWLFTNRLDKPAPIDEGPGPGKAVTWRKVRLDTARARAACFGDFDKDGDMDAASGDFWYANPGWAGGTVTTGTWTKTRFRTMEGSVNANGDGAYKQDGSLSALDVDEDGWIDLVSGSRQAGLIWYRNPGAAGGTWVAAVVDKSGNYETGGLWDINGDGFKREVLSSGNVPQSLWWEAKGGKWIAHSVASDTCDLGAGAADLNGDGRIDIIRPNAWYKAPADAAGAWTRTEIAIGALDDRPFGQPRMDFPWRTPAGPDWMGRNAHGAYGHTSLIHAFDVDKDGKMDIITSSAHRVGLSWWKQLANGELEQRVIDGTWAGAHALGFADVDGDGDPDLVTGKDFRAEGDNDPYPEGELQVVWYELDPGKAFPWIKHVISAGEGIGSGADLGLEDVDKDGDLDLVVAGKQGGPWIFENLSRNPVSHFALPAAKAAPGRKPGRLAFDGSRLVILDAAGSATAVRDLRGKASRASRLKSPRKESR